MRRTAYASPKMPDRQVKARLDLSIIDLGPTQLENIAEPIEPTSCRSAQAPKASLPRWNGLPRTTHCPDKASIAVLPFQKMSDDLAQDILSTVSLKTSSPGCRGRNGFSCSPAIQALPIRAAQST